MTGGRLAGKSAIVTGASSGIGCATATLFAREGARVVLADVDGAGGAAAVEAIRAAGAEALFVRTDVAQATAVEGMVETCVEAFGRLDVLVSNAGIDLLGTVVDTAEADWSRVLDVNLKGMYLCGKHAVAAMRASGGGAIINVASELALVTSTNMAAYIASKGGVVALSRAMARDHAADGIRVNCICPGPVDTPLLDRFSVPGEKEEIEATLPLRRLGQPEDIAPAILQLASDESAWVTGAVWVVDGGATA